MADLFTQLFPDTSRTGDTGPGFGLFFGGPGRGFGRGNQATTSDRLKKKSQVYAVADPRTRTLIVSAASELMPHIEGLVNSLDEIEAHQEVVKTFEFSNADPQDVYGVLQDLLNRSGAIRTSSSSTRSSMLGTQNPLTARETSQNFSSSSSTSFTQGFGSSGGGGGGGRF
jgi:type II secretory pathway component GspD/PulD (secretin)